MIGWCSFIINSIHVFVLQFCNENGIEYLTMRFYIGFWLMAIALLVASIEGSVFIKVFTRFTEEIFASLISLIYIYESVSNIISVSHRWLYTHYNHMWPIWFVVLLSVGPIIVSAVQQTSVTKVGWILCLQEQYLDWVSTYLIFLVDKKRLRIRIVTSWDLATFCYMNMNLVRV